MDALGHRKGLRAPQSQAPALYMQAAAENIAAEDNSYDAVTCIYLFHELPADVRCALPIPNVQKRRPLSPLQLVWI